MVHEIMPSRIRLALESRDRNDVEALLHMAHTNNVEVPTTTTPDLPVGTSLDDSPPPPPHTNVQAMRCAHLLDGAVSS